MAGRGFPWAFPRRPCRQRCDGRPGARSRQGSGPGHRGTHPHPPRASPPPALCVRTAFPPRRGTFNTAGRPSSSRCRLGVDWARVPAPLQGTTLRGPSCGLARPDHRSRHCLQRTPRAKPPLAISTPTDWVAVWRARTAGADRVAEAHAVGGHLDLEALRRLRRELRNPFGKLRGCSIWEEPWARTWARTDGLGRRDA